MLREQGLPLSAHGGCPSDPLQGVWPCGEVWRFHARGMAPKEKRLGQSCLPGKVVEWLQPMWTLRLVADAGVSQAWKGGLPGRGSAGLCVRGGEVAGLTSAEEGKARRRSFRAAPSHGRLGPQPFLAQLWGAEQSVWLARGSKMTALDPGRTPGRLRAASSRSLILYELLQAQSSSKAICAGPRH